MSAVLRSVQMGAHLSVVVGTRLSACGMSPPVNISIHSQDINIGSKALHSVQMDRYLLVEVGTIQYVCGTL